MVLNKKHFVVFSDFSIRSNNRGTAALGYGSISFLIKEGYVDEDFEILRLSFFRNPFRKSSRVVTRELDINGRIRKVKTLYVWAPEKWLFKHNLHFFDTIFRKTVKETLVAAINGGDGLTDIYGDYWFNYRLPEMNLAIELGIPFVLLPQTIGPFLEDKNKERVLSILKKADKIYVRDNNFVDELEKNHLSYTKSNDLSFFMAPMPFPIDIERPCVGINISGLAYSNRFGKLSGAFDNYPLLMTKLLRFFQEEKCKVYLIPHAYNVAVPETNNDDMVATRAFYDNLDDKEGVFFVDKDLLSPQVKFLISQMDFFIGSRMHANYAAIFTGTPVFGLAYSYKFKGAFENNGIFDRVYEINNLKETEIDDVILAVSRAYKEDCARRRHDRQVSNA